MAVAGYGVAAVVHLLFAAYLAASGRLRGEQPLASGLLFAAVLCSAAWAAASAVSVVYKPLLWPAAAALFDWARYGFWFAFLLVSIGLRRRGTGDRLLTWLRRAIALALGLVLLLLALRLVAGSIEAPPSRLLLVCLLTLPLGGALLIEQLFRNLGDGSRWNAKPVCLGLACIFAFDIYLYSTALMVGGFDRDALAARGAAHLLAVPFLFVAARRRSDWVARLQVSRAAAFHSATLVLVGLYLLFMSSIGYYVRYFGGDWGRALQLTLVFASVALLLAFVFSGSLRAKLRVFVGKNFFSYRYDYREEWLRFTAKLATQSAPGEVGMQVVRGLADMVECPAGSLWTRTDSSGPLTQTARWNMSEDSAEEPADSPFCSFLREKAWVVDLDEFRASPRRYEGLALPAWLLGTRDPWLIVPLQVGDELLGFVLLARPRTAIGLDWEVLDLLKTASRQAAGVLAQMRATEALLEARKFEAFNRMSAFVVHDLKNIVTQLSLMLKNAERLHDNREFQQDMLLTVESSLEKMRRLMLQLREGAAPPGGASGVELGNIVARLQVLAEGQGRALEVERLDKLATRGHDDRLERVLGHLVQNALDATPQDGRVWLRVERYSGQVRIEIGDTGAGMTEEFVRKRLFKPFSTTKHSGMGVGSYESHQYIRELGGSIAVDSAPGRGTVLTVLLPLFERQHGSDLVAQANP
ncbi:MAG: XrtA/PEP-CTERM system histidine kinase PrsK [Rubrivivax sp.]